MNKLLYHVTPEYNLLDISMNGIKQDVKQIKKSVIGGNLSDINHIYAFDNYIDAVLWASRIGWNNKGTSIIIISYKDDKPYKKDTHFESVGAIGNWLKRKGSVRASKISCIKVLTKKMTKEAVKQRDILYNNQPDIMIHQDTIRDYKAIIEKKRLEIEPQMEWFKKIGLSKEMALKRGVKNHMSNILCEFNEKAYKIALKQNG